MRLLTTTALALALAAGGAAGAEAQNQTSNPGGQHQGGQHQGGQGQPQPGLRGGAPHPTGQGGAAHPGGPPPAGAPSHPGGRYQGPLGGNGEHGAPGPAAGNGGQHGVGNDRHGGWSGHGQGWNGERDAFRFREHPLRGRDQGRGWYDPDRFAHQRWAARRFHIESWRRPAGWYARSWSFGMYLPFGWYAPDYYLDWAAYDLPAPPVGCEWVRQGSDAVLVDIYTGEVLSVYQGVFW